ncbi:hypothetical protein BDN72DRAFT_4380 [Pluteus cervinus]|uniref:Uncharacterized protein n=1 Tax=Pluteus cervinus TaxID=181527 RepID=A0ACD3BI36_9AGAR|nr:hypothetical protein BDN72DRAFT_4380 [Pluteus cervinus]
MDPESYPFPPSSRSPPSLDNRPSLSFAPRPRLLPLPSVSPLPSPSSPRPPSVDVASRRLVYTTRRTTMDYPMTSFASLSSQNSPINLDGRSDLPLGPEHEAIILTGRAENPNTPVPGSDTASTTSASSIPMEPTTTTPAPQRRRLVRRTAAERTHVVDLTGQDEPPPGPPLHRLPLPRQIGPQSPRMTVPPSVAFRHLYERSPLFSEPTMVDDSTTSLGRSVAAREAGQVAGNGQTTQLLSFVSALERDLQALRHSMAQQQPSDPNLLNSIVTTAGHLRLSALDQRHARTVDSATAPRRSVLTRTGVPHPVPWNNLRARLWLCA